MSGLSESAQLVKQALEKRGLETPMAPNPFSREEKKEKIEHHMREILSLLELDLADDSWKKRRDALPKCTSTKSFLAWIIRTSPRSP